MSCAGKGVSACVWVCSRLVPALHGIAGNAASCLNHEPLHTATLPGDAARCVVLHRRLLWNGCQESFGWALPQLRVQVVVLFFRHCQICCHTSFSLDFCPHQGGGGIRVCL